jgi:hypothetical protein
VIIANTAPVNADSKVLAYSGQPGGCCTITFIDGIGVAGGMNMGRIVRHAERNNIALIVVAIGNSHGYGVSVQFQPSLKRRHDMSQAETKKVNKSTDACAFLLLDRSGSVQSLRVEAIGSRFHRRGATDHGLVQEKWKAATVSTNDHAHPNHEGTMTHATTPPTSGFKIGVWRRNSSSCSQPELSACQPPTTPKRSGKPLKEGSSRFP